MPQKIPITLLCGGPSSERSISLNSTRSVLDNLDKHVFEVTVIYYDLYKNPYLIPSAQIYSNTVSDFEFKIAEIGKPLTEEALTAFLKKQALVWPIMHGEFGEDGEIQKFLEKIKVNFVGSTSQACQLTINKFKCQKTLKKSGLFTFGTMLLKQGDPLPQLDPGRYVLKPNRAGSSIGVEFLNIPDPNHPNRSAKQSQTPSAGTIPNDFKKKLKQVFYYGNEAVLEKFCPGKEFTLIVLENAQGEPVPLIPTEVEFKNQDSFFSFRKKYLATDHIHFHTPPRFEKKVLAKISQEAKKVYKLFNLQDYARFDGWVMPNGEIWFSDLNSITGMEQNSFVFRQAAFLGLNHRDILHYLVGTAARRTKLKIPTQDPNAVLNPHESLNPNETNESNESAEKQQAKQKIAVIFGGSTAERQISLLSGTNVWIKLKSSDQYSPVPIVMDKQNNFWLIPHFYCLHHTVEEIEFLIKQLDAAKIKEYQQMAQKVQQSLGLTQQINEPLFLPEKYSFEKLTQEFDFIFLALHGGIGEDGTLQKKLEKIKKPFNGSSAEASRVGMDKMETGKIIEKAGISGLKSLKKRLIQLSEFEPLLKEKEGSLKRKQFFQNYWKQLKQDFDEKPLLIKPRGDGCSAGVVKLNDEVELAYYLNYIINNQPLIPGGIFKDHPHNIELPQDLCSQLLIEEFIETDEINIIGKEIEWKEKTGWIEISAGVLGNGGKIHALNPSQTIAMGKVLSVEEKFQGGTGINFTPLPKPWISDELLKSTQEKITLAAKALNLTGYARLDCFLNIKTAELILIEANTLPALTPSTIIYHQALKEKPPLPPLKFLETIIELGFARAKSNKKA